MLADGSRAPDLHELAARNWLLDFTSVQTRRSYAASVADFLVFMGAASARALGEARRSHAIGWRDDLLKSGYSPRTVAARMAALSSLYRALLEQGLISHNPFGGVRRPKIAPGRVEAVALSRWQVRAVLNEPSALTLSGIRDRAILRLLFFTGCRVSEPCGLRVGDLKTDQGYRVLDFTIKGGKRHRVAIHPELEAAIDAYLERAGHRDDLDAWLFQPLRRAQADRPLSHDTINRVFRIHAWAAGLPQEASVHSARATFITEALRNGHPVDAVQRSVGHASVITTLAYDKRGHSPAESASFAVNYAI